MPHSHHHFQSLKGSHSNFKNNPINLTKRHSLDSRPAQIGLKHTNLIENVEDFSFSIKRW